MDSVMKVLMGQCPPPPQKKNGLEPPLLLGLCLHTSSIPIRGGSTLGQEGTYPPDSLVVSPRFKS